LNEEETSTAAMFVQSVCCLLAALSFGLAKKFLSEAWAADRLYVDEQQFAKEIASEEERERWHLDAGELEQVPADDHLPSQKSLGWISAVSLAVAALYVSSFYGRVTLRSEFDLGTLIGGAVGLFFGTQFGLRALVERVSGDSRLLIDDCVRWLRQRRGKDFHLAALAGLVRRDAQLMVPVLVEVARREQLMADVRVRALRLLTKCGARSVGPYIPEIASALWSESQRVRKAALKVLRQMSGQGFGYSVRDWKSWWARESRNYEL
jgi:hypothetical protein